MVIKTQTTRQRCAPPVIYYTSAYKEVVTTTAQHLTTRRSKTWSTKVPYIPLKISVQTRVGKPSTRPVGAEACLVQVNVRPPTPLQRGRQSLGNRPSPRPPRPTDENLSPKDGHVFRPDQGTALEVIAYKQRRERGAEVNCEISTLSSPHLSMAVAR